MEAVLSIDTTKGNSVINVNGLQCLRPSRLYILRYSGDILDIMQRTTERPLHFGVSMQDITLTATDFSISTAFCSPPQRLPPQ